MSQEEELPHYVYTLAYPEDMSGYVFYVGKGIGDRIDQHEREARKERNRNTRKENTIRKIWRAGGQIVKKKVALFITHEEALLFEQALIILMRPYGHLTNLTDGGEGLFGVDEEVRRKLSEANSRNWTAEARNRAAERMRGKKHFQEIRNKMSESRKGRVFSEETRRKISENTKQQWAHRRTQTLSNLDYPVISSTDVSWKQGVIQASLWEEGA